MVVLYQVCAHCSLKTLHIWRPMQIQPHFDDKDLAGELRSAAIVECKGPFWVIINKFKRTTLQRSSLREGIVSCYLSCIEDDIAFECSIVFRVRVVGCHVSWIYTTVAVIHVHCTESTNLKLNYWKIKETFTPKNQHVKLWYMGNKFLKDVKIRT